MAELIIKTKKAKEVVDITDKISEFLKSEKRDAALAHLFLTHTTAALASADLDPGGTDLDYLEAFEKMLPQLKYRHPHNPSHMPAHILSSLIGISLTVPVQGGKLVLGTWQRIVLLEFDGPRERRIIISFL